MENYPNIAALALIAAIGLSGCGGGGGDDGGAQSSSVSKITTSKSEFTATPRKHDAINVNIPLDVSLTSNVDNLFWRATTDADLSSISNVDTEPFVSEPFISFSLKPYSEKEERVYSEVVTFDFCFDSECERKIQGSPFTIRLDYDVVHPGFSSGAQEKISFETREDNPFSLSQTVEIPLNGFNKEEYVFLVDTVVRSNSSDVACYLSSGNESVVCSYTGYLGQLEEEDKSKETEISLQLCGFFDYDCENPEDSLSVSFAYDFIETKTAEYTVQHKYPLLNSKSGMVYLPYYDAVLGTDENGYALIFGDLSSGEYVDFYQYFHFGIPIDLRGNIQGVFKHPTNEKLVLLVLSDALVVFEPNMSEPTESKFTAIELKKDSLSHGVISSYYSSGNFAYVIEGGQYQNYQRIHAIDLTVNEDRAMKPLDEPVSVVSIDGKAITKEFTTSGDVGGVYEFSPPSYAVSLDHIKDVSSFSISDSNEGCKFLGVNGNEIYSICGERFVFNSSMNQVSKLSDVPMPSWSDPSDWSKRVDLVSYTVDLNGNVYFALAHSSDSRNRGKYIHKFSQELNSFIEYELMYDAAGSRFGSIFVRVNGEIWAAIGEVDSNELGVGKVEFR
ncbi:hypothetical protein [Enterovibrio norvegicus]|uniref:Uncharacterized protein n=1 Tax=Enterovibrio norvegicus TaxID=188144 RepID=A0A2N7L8I1_9GAMM|nr:hypothetical protein [Enterovibrio norvegicus]PMN90519.1 hypothetical protein BCT23_19805 [Enterovibrio norvegicus]